MKNKNIKLIVPILLSCMLMGCSSGTQTLGNSFNTKSDSLKSYDTVSSQMDYEEMVQTETGSIRTTDSGDTNQSDIYQKLIKRVYMQMESTDFESDISSIKNQVAAVGGYVESLSLTGNSLTEHNAVRDSNMIIRIPEDKLDDFLNAAEAIGNIRYKSEEITDITLQYIDTEEHLKSLRQEQERLAILMNQAENIEDILQIESRLSQIRYEVESYASQIKIYDNQINYSTIDLSIREVKIYSTQKDGILTRMLNGMRNNFDFISHFLINMVVLFVSSLPTIAIFGCIILIVVQSIRCNEARKKRKKKNKMQDEPKTEK